MNWKIVLFRMGCLLLLILAAFPLAGCWDRREIEERTSTLAIAVDKDKEDPSQYRVSVQIAIPFKISGSTGGAEGKYGNQTVQVMSSTGRSISECFQRLQRSLNEELFYGHTRIVAIGEEVAKEGLEPILDPFRRHPEIRRLLWPVVVQGEGVELLKAAPSLTQIPTVFTMRLIQSGIEMQRIPNIILGDFYIDQTSPNREPYLNYFEVNKNDISWTGVALFDEDRMIGRLDPLETWELMRIREDKDGEDLLLEMGEPNRLVTLTMEHIRSKDSVSYDNGRIVIRTKIVLEGRVREKTIEENLFTEEQFSMLEQKAAMELEARSKRLVDELQHKYKVDTIGYGGMIKAHYPKIWDQIDWQQEYPEADIKISYEYHLRNIGMVYR